MTDRTVPDPHLAAYARGLEDAARECSTYISEARERAALEDFEARIRALSKLPPGTRVVVVPPDAEERMARAFIAHVFEPDEGILSWDDVPADDQTITLRGMTAALRALTGGEK